MRYHVYEATPFGAIRVAAELDATDDSDALKQARVKLPKCTGELRHNGRVVCRFGRAKAIIPA